MFTVLAVKGRRRLGRKSYKAVLVEVLAVAIATLTKLVPKTVS